MTFFLDNNISPKIVLLLGAMDVGAVHLIEQFAVDTPDTEWLPVVARNGWVLVTGDRAIRTRPPERQALSESGVKAVFLHKSIMALDRNAQCAWFLKHWNSIGETVVRAPRGACFMARLNGRLELLG